jgi:hypothetical protein
LRKDGTYHYYSSQLNGENSFYLAKIENLSSDEYVRKLSMSEAHTKTAANLFQDAASQVAALGSKGDLMVRNT